MLAAAGVLKENGKKNNAIQFSVENIDVLRHWHEGFEFMDFH